MFFRSLLAFLVALGVSWGQDPKPKPEEPDVQEPKVSDPQPKPEPVITVRGPYPLTPREPFNIPWSTNAVWENDLREWLSRTAGNTLIGTPGAHVQKTGPGQGTPFLRGLDPYRTLVLIDGIRLNHSAMRAGPNQYFGTIDPFLIGREEVVFGPASVLYGSDSMGGTVYIHSRIPFSFEKGKNLHKRSAYRYSSAEDSHTGRQEFFGNMDNLGWSIGGTYNDPGDLIGGRHVGRMEGMEYDEYAVDAKIGVRIDEASTVFVGAQQHRINDRPRWHSTIYNDDGWQGLATGNDLRRDQDQERNLYFVQYYWDAGRGKGEIIDAFQGSLSLQRHGEEKTRYRTGGRRKTERFVVVAPGVWIKAGKQTGLGYFTVGGDAYRDNVRSESHDQNREFDRGIVAGDATVQTFGAFVQDEFSIGDLDVTAGIRIASATVDAEDVDPAVVDDDPATLDNPSIPNSIDESYSAVIGSVRLLYHVTQNWNAIAGWGRGFRAPTLHDSTAIDFVLSGGQIQVPAEDLDPEYIDTFDLGVRTKYDDLEISAFVFYSRLSEFLAKVDTVDVDGDGTTDQKVDNFSDGWVKGAEVLARYHVTDEVSVSFGFGYAKGKADHPSDGDEEPLPKVGPARAHLGVRFVPEESGVWVEAVVTAADEQSHLDLGAKGGGDAQRQPVNGTPGYAILTLRGGVAVTENLTLTAAIENVTNKDYRIHGSGQNEPGTNAILGVDFGF